MLETTEGGEARGKQPGKVSPRIEAVQYEKAAKLFGPDWAGSRSIRPITTGLWRKRESILSRSGQRKWSEIVWRCRRLMQEEDGEGDGCRCGEENPAAGEGNRADEAGREMITIHRGWRLMPASDEKRKVEWKIAGLDLQDPVDLKAGLGSDRGFTRGSWRTGVLRRIRVRLPAVAEKSIKPAERGGGSRERAAQGVGRKANACGASSRSDEACRF